jgi:hypothetical protein
VPLAAQQWSVDERYVLYRVNRGYGPRRRDAHVVVDTRTHAMFTLENTSQIMFAPDHTHVVAVAAAELTVYDLATGRPVGTKVPIAGVARFAPDGRLAWAERVAAGYRIHVRQLATGDERLLEGMPAAPPQQPTDRELVKLEFDDRAHVIAFHSAALRAWQIDRPEPIVVVDDALVADPQVSSDGIAYAIEDARERTIFQHIDLAAATHEPVELQRDPRCGRGELRQYSYFTRCTEHRYLVATAKGSFCVWDTATGRARARFRPFRDEYHCNAELAWVGDTPPGGPYTFFSLRTGKEIRQPRGFEPPHYDAPTEEDPAAPPADFVHPAKLAGLRDTLVSPGGNLIAGALEDRASLWNAAGDLVWQAAAASDAAALGFTPRGELVVVGRTGQLWRIDLATRSMQRTSFASCDLTDGAIAIVPDGRIAAACHRRRARVVLLEGEPEPLITRPEYGWSISAAHRASTSTIAWESGDGAHAWSLPDGKARWTYPSANVGLSVTADGNKFATVTPIGELGASGTRFALSIRDAANQQLATAMLPAAPRSIVLSPDGAQIAVVGYLVPATADHEVTIFDTARGTMIDQLRAGAATVAWDPTGKPRLAYARVTPSAAVVIRDVVARRDTDTHAADHLRDGLIQAIAWSSDGTRLAALADSQVTLWENRCAPSTFSFAGAGAAERRSDGAVVTLGEPAAARALINVSR